MGRPARRRPPPPAGLGPRLHLRSSSKPPRPRLTPLAAAATCPLPAPKVEGKSVAASGLTLLSGVRLISASRAGQPVYSAPVADARASGPLARLRALWTSPAAGLAAAAAAAIAVARRGSKGGAGAAAAGGGGGGGGGGGAPTSGSDDTGVVVDVEDPAASHGGAELQAGDVLRFQARRGVGLGAAGSWRGGARRGRGGSAWALAARFAPRARPLHNPNHDPPPSPQPLNARAPPHHSKPLSPRATCGSSRSTRTAWASASSL
jgi:hypothetical protein